MIGEWFFCASDLNCWAWWTKEFQGLIAGMLAIVAGGLAFRGAWLQALAARAQAEAITRSAEDESRERRRAAAAALWAELAQCGVRLHADRVQLRNRQWADAARIRRVYTPIFSSNPVVVGVLEAHDAYMVTQAYVAMQHIDAVYAFRIAQRNGFLGEEADTMARGIDTFLPKLVGALDGLRPTAGITEANAAVATREFRDAA